MPQDTLITCIPHVYYGDGTKQDVKSITKTAHNNDSLLLLDAYQSIGQIDIDVKQMDVDIMVAGARKYMLGIPGVAFMYIKQDLLARLTPNSTGWLGQDPKQRFNIDSNNLADDASKFETDTKPFVSIYAAYEALNLLLDIGMVNVENYLQQLIAYCVSYSEKLGLPLVSSGEMSTQSSLIAFKVKDAHKISQLMSDKNINVSSRNDVIRIAPHFYNTKQDIKQALDVLASFISVE